MPNMQAVFYRKRGGTEAVDDFISGLPIASKVTLDGQTEMLNPVPPPAPPPPLPHSSQVRGPLRELRCHYGRKLYRILYRRSDNLFILLHMLRKDRGDLLESDIATAQEHWEDFKARMNADPRVPPRAAGHDAP